MAEKTPRFEILELTSESRQALLDRLRPGCTVSEEDARLIAGMLVGLPDLLALIEKDDMSLRRLRRILFGARTEKTSAVLPATSPVPPPPPVTKPKRPGHGRRGADAFAAARRVQVPHPHLHPGDPCPKCLQGKLYSLNQPGVLFRFVAQAPVTLTIFEQGRLRCADCGEVITAPPPPEAGTGKYDESVGAMLSLLRFGAGEPFHRLAALQRDCGLPLAESTQWDLVNEQAPTADLARQALIRQAAQRSVLHNDDTGMRVASLRRKGRAAGSDPEPEPEPETKRPRTGIFTTGIVTGGEEPPIALFFTGRQHAGENLRDLLAHRASELPPPIQMCDALSRNLPKGMPTLLAHCLAHGRRQFVDVAENFPDQVRHVLESLGQVYQHDAEASEQGLDPQARLKYHQTRSAPVMDELQRWLTEQQEQKKVEPNSGLGKAIAYLLPRWESFTVFLREAGAPLDNNICERSLKMAILHRKNSLSYRTERGAEVGDIFMSLIHTCRLNAVNAFDYLVALARNARQVAEKPDQWLPWNYRSAMVPDSS